MESAPMSVDRQVFDWLVQEEIVKKANARKHQGLTVQLDAETSHQFENGILINALLDVIKRKTPKLQHVPRITGLKNMNTPYAKLHNWNLLAPVLTEKVKIDVGPDNKSLIIAGELLLIVDVIEQLYHLAESRHISPSPAGRGELDSLQDVAPAYETVGMIETSPTTVRGFLVTTLCHALPAMKEEEAKGLVTRGLKQLKSAITTGLKVKGFHPIVKWFQDVFSKSKLLSTLLQKETKSYPLILELLRSGLISKNYNVVQWIGRIIPRLGLDSPLLAKTTWNWLNMENGGLNAILVALKQHPDIKWALFPTIDTLLCKNYHQFFTQQLRKTLPEAGNYLSFMHDILAPLESNPGARENFVSDGLVENLIDLAVSCCSSSHDANTRIAAIALLGDIWLLFQDQVEEEEAKDVPKLLLGVMKRSCRDSSKQIQLCALTCLFNLLDVFANARSPYAPFVYKTLIFSLIENHSHEDIRQYIIDNMTVVLESMPRIPVAVLIAPLIKQTNLHGYHNRDFDFYVVLAKHHRLDVKSSTPLVELLFNIALNDALYARLATVPLMILLARFHSSEMMQDFTEHFARQGLQTILKIENKRAKASHEQPAKTTLLDSSKIRETLVVELLAKMIHLRKDSYLRILQRIVNAAYEKHNETARTESATLTTLMELFDSRPLLSEKNFVVPRHMQQKSDSPIPLPRSGSEVVHGFMEKERKDSAVIADEDDAVGEEDIKDNFGRDSRLSHSNESAEAQPDGHTSPSPTQELEQLKVKRKSQKKPRGRAQTDVEFARLQRLARLEKQRRDQEAKEKEEKRLERAAKRNFELMEKAKQRAAQERAAQEAQEVTETTEVEVEEEVSVGSDVEAPRLVDENTIAEWQQKVDEDPGVDVPNGLKKEPLFDEQLVIPKSANVDPTNEGLNIVWHILDEIYYSALETHVLIPIQIPSGKFTVKKDHNYDESAPEKTKKTVKVKKKVQKSSTPDIPEPDIWKDAGQRSVAIYCRNLLYGLLKRVGAEPDAPTASDKERWEEKEKKRKAKYERIRKKAEEERIEKLLIEKKLTPTELKFERERRAKEEEEKRKKQEAEAKRKAHAKKLKEELAKKEEHRKKKEEERLEEEQRLKKAMLEAKKEEQERQRKRREAQKKKIQKYREQMETAEEAKARKEKEEAVRQAEEKRKQMAEFEAKRKEREAKEAAAKEEKQKEEEKKRKEQAEIERKRTALQRQKTDMLAKKKQERPPKEKEEPKESEEEAAPKSTTPRKAPSNAGTPRTQEGATASPRGGNSSAAASPRKQTEAAEEEKAEAPAAETTAEPTHEPTPAAVEGVGGGGSGEEGTQPTQPETKEKSEEEGAKDLTVETRNETIVAPGGQKEAWEVQDPDTPGA